MHPLRTRTEKDALNVRLEGPMGRTKKMPGCFYLIFIVQTSCSQLTEMGHVNYWYHIYLKTNSYLKPVLNWANVCSRTYLEVFSEASWFLIGRTFLREPSWKCSSKLYTWSKKLRSACSGNIRRIRRTLPLIG